MTLLALCRMSRKWSAVAFVITSPAGDGSVCAFTKGNCWISTLWYPKPPRVTCSAEFLMKLGAHKSTSRPSNPQASHRRR